MNNLYNTIAMLLICLLLAGCCIQSSSCFSFLPIEIYFEGFESSDLDTVFVTGYEKSESTFTTVTVEQYAVEIKTRPNDNEESSELITYFTLGDDHHWDVYIPKTNQHYYLNNYSTREFTCKEGCGHKQLERVIESFHVNGDRIKGHRLGVHK